MENLESAVPNGFVLLIQKSVFALVYPDDYPVPPSIHAINSLKTVSWILALECFDKNKRKQLGSFKNKEDAISEAKKLGFGGVRVCSHYWNPRKRKSWNVFTFGDEKDWKALYGYQG